MQTTTEKRTDHRGADQQILGRAEALTYLFPQEMLKPPSVSIVVTNHNYARYLPACLRSIAQQTYSRFECVIVDDVSTDDSVDEVRRFLATKASGGRFRLIEHEENRGQMAGFKTGLENTSGTFVVFVDSDDVLLPDFIETHLKAHLNGSYAVAFTCSDQLQIDDDGEVVASTYPQVCKVRDRESGKKPRGLPALLSWTLSSDDALPLRQQPQDWAYLPALSGFVGDWFWSTTSAMMYRRAALELVLSDDCDQFCICADYYLVTFSQAVGGSLVIPTVHGAYRRHGQNGFSHSAVVGGEHSPGNHLTHPPYGKFNESFVRHAVGSFDQFVSVLGTDRAHLLVARFAPKKLFRKLLLRGPQHRNPLLSRCSLLRQRFFWRTLKVYYALSSRFRFVRNVMTAKK
ncbi:MAG: glycosyltransferase family A protein [Pseudomonadota bacterium]